MLKVCLVWKKCIYYYLCDPSSLVSNKCSFTKRQNNVLVTLSNTTKQNLNI